jgi:hypothetical protein
MEQKMIFIYKSVENRFDQKEYKCSAIKEIGIGKILVNISPPIQNSAYGIPSYVDQAVLSPRYKGTQIFPRISEQPCTVNLLIAKAGEHIDIGPWRILDVGDINNDH